MPTSQLEKGPYPVVYSNGIGYYHKYYKCKAPGLVTGRSGTIGHFTYIKDGYYWPHNTTLWVTDFKANEPLFIEYLYKNKHFENFMMGSGVPTLNRNEIHKEHSAIPNLAEQQSLGSFFSSFDRLLSDHHRRLENLRRVKKSMLQKMFPQQGQTVPEIRFKGFSGEWEKAKLSSVAKRITRKNTNLECTMPVTISSQDGIVEQTSFFNNIVASSNLSNYYLIKRGEFAYNKSYSNGYPFGSVKRLDKYEEGALSTLYILFSLNEEVSSDFIIYYFETSLWHNEVAQRATEGARNHGLLNIGAEDFLDIEILLPQSIDEQQRIGSFFTSLDNLINDEVNYIDQLTRVKSTLLQKMFV